MPSRLTYRLLLGLLLFCATPLLKASKTLDIYYIDTDGGHAVLFVSPSGQSMLIDTGWPGLNGRDADRIVQVAKLARLKQIDCVVITHYHRDHVGGIVQLAERLKIGTFVDHGPYLEDTDVVREDYAAYLKVRANGTHLQVKPGDKIPVEGLDVTVLTSAGEHIANALPGAGQPNPACATATKRAVDPTENARSLGTLIQYGDFKTIDLGDLWWNQEAELVCPNNLVGTVSLYLTTDHGSQFSNNPALVRALHPRVAIVNNAARKGGAPDTYQTLIGSPGLKDVWQLHYSIEGGSEHNARENHIANVDEACEGKYLKVSAKRDGAFTVYNSRNQFTQTYAAKGH